MLKLKIIGKSFNARLHFYVCVCVCIVCYVYVIDSLGMKLLKKCVQMLSAKSDSTIVGHVLKKT